MFLNDARSIKARGVVCSYFGSVASMAFFHLAPISWDFITSRSKNDSGVDALVFLSAILDDFVL